LNPGKQCDTPGEWLGQGIGPKRFQNFRARDDVRRLRRFDTPRQSQISAG
jgi:hypothetical protein